jgi:hypothetical protein
VSEFFEDKAYNLAFLAIEEEGTQFCLCRQGYDKLEDATECVDSSIELDWLSLRWV